MYKIDVKKLEHSPRMVKFWECCLAVFYENLGEYNYEGFDATQNETVVNVNGLVENKDESKFFLDTAYNYYLLGNANHRSAYEVEDDFKDAIFQRRVKPSGSQNKVSIVLEQEIIVSNSEKILKPRIALANIKVLEGNIERGIRKNPNLEKKRFDTLYKIFKQTKEEKADILLFPECFIPVEFLDRVTWYAVNEQKLVVTGLEHITINDVSFNFIVTILPFERDGVKDAVVVYRLKNHYTHEEKLMIHTNHYRVPKPEQTLYDLFIWKGIYFSPYYCFELADVNHRSIFKSKVDLLIASEWNRDVNYFSNIVESISRDIHAYFAQVNTSQFGDSRITQPSKTEIRDILKLKGGENGTILVGEIDLGTLREFQRKLYITTKEDKTYKPLPPDFSLENVLKRINGSSVL